ncbi:MAG: hypothetical protein JWQ71_2516 [Pedosphaera sp.]|nr:hypothetical protein [Pedosphaera sp.]
MGWNTPWVGYYAQVVPPLSQAYGEAQSVINLKHTTTKSYVRNNRNNPSRPLVAGNGHFLHHWWIHSHPVGARHHRHFGARHPGPQTLAFASAVKLKHCYV